MKLNEKLEELKSRCYDDELTSEVKNIIDSNKFDSKQQFFNYSLLLIDIYLKLNKNEVAIDELEILNNDTLLTDSIKTLHMVLDKLITLYIGCDNFRSALKCVDKKRKYIDENNSGYYLINFVYSVVYEGLFNYQDAINSLLEIPDNLGKQNIINKYLKLSLLYIENENVDNAIEALENAKDVYPTATNPIFKYVESEILFFKKEYKSAQILFNDFFHKIPTPRKYVDKYLEIQLKLKDYDSALNVFTEYALNIEKSFSNRIKLSFYEKGLQLYKALDNREMVDVYSKRINMVLNLVDKDYLKIYEKKFTSNVDELRLYYDLGKKPISFDDIEEDDIPEIVVEDIKTKTEVFESIENKTFDNLNSNVINDDGNTFKNVTNRTFEDENKSDSSDKVYFKNVENKSFTKITEEENNVKITFSHNRNTVFTEPEKKDNNSILSDKVNEKSDIEHDSTIEKEDVNLEPEKTILSVKTSIQNNEETDILKKPIEDEVNINNIDEEILELNEDEEDLEPILISKKADNEDASKKANKGIDFDNSTYIKSLLDTADDLAPDEDIANEDDISYTEVINTKYDEMPIKSKSIENSMKVFKTISSISSNNRIRDILLVTFRRLIEFSTFQSLFYVDLSTENMMLYKFQKNLLLDQKLTNDQIEDSIVEYIAEQDTIDIFTEAYELEVVDILTSKKYNDEFYIYGSQMINNDNLIGVFCVYSDFSLNDSVYLFQNVSRMINEKVNNILLFRENFKINEEFNNMFKLGGNGLFEIIGKSLYLKSETTQKILELYKEHVLLESILSRITENYVDFEKHLIKHKGKDEDSFDFLYKQSNEEIWINVRYQNVDGNIKGIFTDVTEKKVNSSIVESNNYFDYFTGLFNVNKLYSDYNENTYNDGAISLLEISNISYVNEVHGYIENNRVIQHIANILNDIFRTENYGVYYIGNSKYIVVFKNTKDRRVITKHFVKFKDKVEEKFTTLAGNKILLDIPIGIITDLRGAKNLDSLLYLADKALEISRKKTTYVFFDKTEYSNIIQGVQIEQFITEGIASGNITLQYKPTVSLSDNQVMLYKAYLNKETMLYEDLFMIFGILNKSDLMIRLELYMLEKMILDAEKIYKIVNDNIIFSLRLSPRTILHDKLYPYIKELFVKYSIPTSIIAIEIDLNKFDAFDSNLQDIIAQLSIMGLRIVFDNVGENYGIFDNAKNLRIDYLRISKKIVREIFSNNKIAVVKFIQEMSNQLDIGVVFDGVDNQRILQSVNSVKGKFVAGAMFEQLISAEQLVTLLSQEG